MSHLHVLLSQHKTAHTWHLSLQIRPQPPAYPSCMTYSTTRTTKRYTPYVHIHLCVCHSSLYRLRQTNRPIQPSKFPATLSPKPLGAACMRRPHTSDQHLPWVVLAGRRGTRGNPQVPSPPQRRHAPCNETRPPRPGSCRIRRCRLHRLDAQC